MKPTSWSARVQAGDRQAFREFIEKYQRLVAAIVFRMVYNAADREELSQEYFLKIFANIGQFQGGAQGHGLDRPHRQQHLHQPPAQEAPAAFRRHRRPRGRTWKTSPATAPRPERAERTGGPECLALQGEIDRLPAHYRLVLTLFHFSEMNYDEIGQALALPAGTVKSHLFRARQKLRERLAPSPSGGSMNNGHLTDDQIQEILDARVLHSGPILPLHLGTCARCRERLESFRRLYAGLAADPGFVLPPSFADCRAGKNSRPPRRFFGSDRR